MDYINMESKFSTSNSPSLSLTFFHALESSNEWCLLYIIYAQPNIKQIVLWKSWFKNISLKKRGCTKKCFSIRIFGLRGDKFAWTGFSNKNPGQVADWKSFCWEKYCGSLEIGNLGNTSSKSAIKMHSPVDYGILKVCYTTFQDFAPICIYVPSSSTGLSDSSIPFLCQESFISPLRKGWHLPFWVVTNIRGLWLKVGHLLRVLKFWRPNCVAAYERWVSQAMPTAKSAIALHPSASLKRLEAHVLREKIWQHHPCQLKDPWKAVQGLMVMVVYVGKSHQISDFPGGDEENSPFW